MNELHWWTAYGLADAIRGREVSAREALDHMLRRVEALDGDVNAVVRLDAERAIAAATAADDAIAGGDDLGPLHGVPITIKDSFMTEGCVTTSGSPELAEFVPDHDAWPVARLREAGAIVYAKTNLPLFAGDVQSYNDVYGTTNNPHDLTRTCGGSSGGSAAALAMGFTPIEVGSDIGGSIRVPAHCCGVKGHKPSYGIVPAHGQIPGMPGTLTQADLAVAGPMARSARDMELMLQLMSGPDRWQQPAWKLELPERPIDDFSRLRIAAWLDDPYCPVDGSTRRVLNELVASIESAGGTVDTDARPDFTLEKADRVFKALLFAALSGSHSPDTIERLATVDGDTPTDRARRDTAQRHRDWLANNERRLQLRERWSEFFAGYDVVLMPVQPRGAIPHDHSQPQWGRTVEIDGVERSYLELFTWSAPAGVGMLPSTVVPAGVGDDGLPIGVQIVGPYLHDITTIRAARLISKLRGGAPRPAIAV